MKIGDIVKYKNEPKPKMAGIILNIGEYDGGQRQVVEVYWGIGKYHVEFCNNLEVINENR